MAESTEERGDSERQRLIECRREIRQEAEPETETSTGDAHRFLQQRSAGVTLKARVPELLMVGTFSATKCDNIVQLCLRI